MFLKHLRLNNYRCYADLYLELHPQLNVIVAENGQGKTALLDAIRTGLWPFINGFDLASSGYTDPANSIAIDDVRIQGSHSQDENSPYAYGVLSRHLPVEIELDATWEDACFNQPWIRYRDSEGAGSKTKDNIAARQLKDHAKNLQAILRQSPTERVSLPFFGYYGTGRLWNKKKLTRNKRTKGKASDKTSFHIRTFAYRDCMDPASSYEQFKDWFTWLSQAYLQEQGEQLERQQAGLATIITIPPAISTPLNVVRNSINQVLTEVTGWRNLRYSMSHKNSLILEHDGYGVLKVDQLSDGIRAMLALVGDIAYRCVKLNPHLGIDAAKETSGVVLIDEVDMHLHPRWQQLVLGQLQKAFPKIQFIVTTHSPQVLSTVRRECIRILEQTETGYVARMPDFSPLAHESGDALSKIMGTHRQPPLDLQAQIQEYEQLVRSGQEQTDSARSLYDQLQIAGYQLHESDLATWRFLANRKLGHVG